MVVKNLVHLAIKKIQDQHFKCLTETHIEYKNAFNEQFQQYLKNDPQGSGLYFSFLREIVLLMEPKVIVELGNREGVSTSMLYSALPKHSRLISTDIKRNLGLVTEKAFDDKRVKFIFADSLSAEAVSALSPNTVDLLFIDTKHESDHLRKELKYYEPFLSNEALVLIDDINLKSMKKAWFEIEHEKESYSELHGSGFGVVYFKRKKKETSE